MSDLRLDPLTGRWVVIASPRADRPEAFLGRRLPVEDERIDPCPLCDQVEPPLLERPGSGNWQVRVVRNKYPAFEGSEPMVVSHLGPVHTEAPASGIHEIFVLSPDHKASWADLTVEQSGQVMELVRDRMIDHLSRPNLRYSQAIVNYGREAGASLEHPHGQLLTLPFVPEEITNEGAGFARFPGNCLLCATLDAEEVARHRLIFSDDNLAVISPYWSGTPYEMLIIPRQHGPHLYRAADADVASMGHAIQLALSALRDRLGDVAYNIMFHSAPRRAIGDYHWHVHILPQVSTRGGFELGSGVYINVVSPEQAASELRRIGSPA